MKIIELTDTQFRNYSRLHSNGNYLQTVEFAKMQKVYGFDCTYLGLVDEYNNIVAATLIINKKAFSKFSYGIAPGGFLIDYTNFELLKVFKNQLTKYCFKKDYIYIQVEPRCIINTSDKKEKVVYSSVNTINNIKNLDVINTDNNANNKYAIYLTTKDEETLNKNLSRSTKRNIKECKEMGISIYKGNESNMHIFYNLIRKNTAQEIEYYYNCMNSFDNPNNSFEIYFAKLEPKTYLNNATVMLNKEQKKNDELNLKMKNTKVTNNLLNKKLESDKRVQKYNMKLQEAINMYDKFPNGIIVSACAIIKTNREITFLVDGYEEQLSHIRGTILLRYEIIRQYINQSYTNFNLGFLPKDKSNVSLKNICTVKMGYGANFVEYPDAFHIVTNKFLYNTPMTNKIQIRSDS